MQIVIRADASANIGTGHVMRCLTLAKYLRKKGAEIMFVSRLHTGNLCDLLEHEGFTVHRLPFHRESKGWLNRTSDYAAWLGAGWRQDADETLEAIDALDNRPAWLLVDHYGIDERWEGQLRSAVEHIFVIDDLANRRHDCDVLLDQTFVSNSAMRYSDLIDKGCELLTGPKYALLQPDYSKYRSLCEPRQGRVKRLLIFFGGADQDNFTRKVAEAVLLINKKYLQVDIVLGSSYSYTDAFRTAMAEYRNIHIHSTLPSLAPLMAHADLAIGACGGTTLERMCLGLPSIVVTVAENQKKTAAYLHEKEYIHWLGDAEAVDIEALRKALSTILQQGISAEWSQRCMKLVDGEGTERVAKILFSDCAEKYRARPVTETDQALLLAWANDSQTRRNAFSQKAITLEEHHQWFRRRLEEQNSGCFFYLIEDKRQRPLGQVRFQQVEMETYELHYSLAKQYRGRGIGKLFLETAMKEFFLHKKKASIVARVKTSNIISQKNLSRLSFSLIQEKQIPGVLHYRYPSEKTDEN